MKVLYDHQIYERQKFGGINRYFQELSEFKNKNIESDFIDLNDFIKPKMDILSKMLRFIKRKMGYKYESTYQKLKTEVLKKIISESEYDILHPTFYDTYYLDYLKKPFVITVHDMTHEILPDFFDVKNATALNKKIICEKANHIIAISETTKNDLINILNIDKEKITTIYHGSNFHKIKPEKPAALDEFKNYLLFTGQRWAYKNFRFMIENLADFLIKDDTLTLICTGSAFTREEIELLEKLKISKKVINYYAKNDNELAWLYQNAIAFIFPSLYEGFGFPLLEAFASRCPVISSDGGALKEIGGKGACFFNPTNKNEFKAAVYSVLYNSDIRNQFIEYGLMEYSKYNWDTCREQTLYVYNKVLNKNSN